jgi:hypothetical protein
LRRLSDERLWRSLGDACGGLEISFRTAVPVREWAGPLRLRAWGDASYSFPEALNSRCTLPFLPSGLRPLGA